MELRDLVSEVARDAEIRSVPATTNHMGIEMDIQAASEKQVGSVPAKTPLDCQIEDFEASLNRMLEAHRLSVAMPMSSRKPEQTRKNDKK